MTSKDVSRLLWRFGLKAKMGHVGTLDPGADGVLPVLLGKATVLQDYLLAVPKAYSFSVLFGYATDSLDADGLVVRQAPSAHITREQLGAAVRGFLGEQEQIPPAYSAVKFRGQPLYKLARKGTASDELCKKLRRNVYIYSLTLEGFSHGLARFSVLCSKGTYVRVLAQDIAAHVGSCATVIDLQRTSSAGISLTQCLSLSTLETALRQEYPDYAALVQPIEKLALGLEPLQAASPESMQRLLAGQELNFSRQNFIGSSIENRDNSSHAPGGEDGTVLLLTPEGVALGIGTVIRSNAGGIKIRMKRSLG